MFIFLTNVQPDMGVGKAPRVASFHAFELTLKLTKKYSIVLKACKPTLKEVFSLVFPKNKRNFDFAVQTQLINSSFRVKAPEEQFLNSIIVLVAVKGF